MTQEEEEKENTILFQQWGVVVEQGPSNYVTDRISMFIRLCPTYPFIRTKGPWHLLEYQAKPLDQMNHYDWITGNQMIGRGPKDKPSMF